MVSNAPVGAGEEVFNTYGDGLSNAQLLVRYGFALDGNEHDAVRFEWGTDLRRGSTPLNGESGGMGTTDEDGVRCRVYRFAEGTEHAKQAQARSTFIGHAGPPSAGRGGDGGNGGGEASRAVAASAGPNLLDDLLLRRVLLRWPAHHGWDGSGLVYNVPGLPCPSSWRDGDGRSAPACNDDGGAGDSSGSSSTKPLLAVNADGRVSHPLWVLAALSALAAEPRTMADWAADAADGGAGLVASLQDGAARVLALEEAASLRDAAGVAEEDNGACEGASEGTSGVSVLRAAIADESPSAPGARVTPAGGIVEADVTTSPISGTNRFGLEIAGVARALLTWSRRRRERIAHGCTAQEMGERIDVSAAPARVFLGDARRRVLNLRYI
jgi:hypothetical protein